MAQETAETVPLWQYVKEAFDSGNEERGRELDKALGDMFAHRVDQYNHGLISAYEFAMFVTEAALTPIYK